MTSTDADRYRSSPQEAWNYYSDSITHYWTGSGDFENNDNIGTSVEYIAPPPCDDTITVYADDDHTGEGNIAFADENATSDSETVTIVGCEVYRVGFTGDHELYKTPPEVRNPDPLLDKTYWDDGITKITDPIWTKDSPNNATTDFVCYTKLTKPTVTFQYRVSAALTEGSTFQVAAQESPAYYSAVNLSIGAGETESNVGSRICSHALSDYVNNRAMTLQWYFRVSNGADQPRTLNSSAHTLFVTYGTPAPGGVDLTVLRIDWVTDAATGESELDACAAAVFGKLNDSGITYNLNGEPGGPTPHWRLHVAGYISQCPGLSLYVNDHFKMLGLGSGTLKYCHATAAGGYIDRDDYNPEVSRTIESPPHATPTTHDDNRPTELLIHWDGTPPENGGPQENLFEATCYFNSKYYALGVGNGIYTSAKSVVTTAFTDIKWFYQDGSGDWINCPHNQWSESNP